MLDRLRYDTIGIPALQMGGWEKYFLMSRQLNERGDKHTACGQYRAKSLQNLRESDEQV